MELKQLEYFKAIAEQGTLSKAGEQLYVTQSALSKSIARLEEEFGFSLFDHQKNKLLLNDMGKQLIPYVDNILTSVQQLEFFIEHFQKQQHVIRLVSTNSFVFRHMLSLFMEHFTDIEFRHTIAPHSALRSMLLQGESDIAIYLEPLHDPGIIEIPLYHEYLKILVPPEHPLYSKESFSVQDLDGETVVVSDGMLEDARAFLQLYTDRKIRIRLMHVEDWVLTQGLLRNTRYLLFASNVSEKHIPIPPGMNCLTCEDLIPGFTDFTYLFAFSKEHREYGDIYLKLKSVF